MTRPRLLTFSSNVGQQSSTNCCPIPLDARVVFLPPFVRLTMVHWKGSHDPLAESLVNERQAA